LINGITSFHSRYPLSFHHVHWPPIPQLRINALCEGFALKLELCLVNERLWKSNQPFEMTDRGAMKSLFMANRRYAP
jgi:hypothetical protein